MSNLIDEFDEDSADTFLRDLDPDAEALLYNTELQSRVFIMNDSSPAIMGMMMEEADDSFLVGLPAKVVGNADGTATAVPYLRVRYFRVQKSSVKFVTHLFSPYTDHYLTYLHVHGREIFPALMDLIEEEEDLGSNPEMETEVVVPSNAEDDFSKVVSNMDKEDEERIAKAIQCGGLVIPEKKTMQ